MSIVVIFKCCCYISNGFSCSIDSDSGMISANLTIVASDVYSFKCKVLDNYIADSECSYACNVANGTAVQIRMCKDRCRQVAEAISDVHVTVKSIGEEPVWTGASIRLEGNSLQWWLLAAEFYVG